MLLCSDDPTTVIGSYSIIAKLVLLSLTFGIRFVQTLFGILDLGDTFLSNQCKVTDSAKIIYRIANTSNQLQFECCNGMLFTDFGP
jgi:hypothetical protein